MEVFYSAASLDPRDPNTFVALNTQNRMNFPLAYIVTCEANQLRDDGEMMEACLKTAGVPVKSDYYLGLPHYLWIFPSVTERQKFIGNLVGGRK
jgi:versiconal hemiacetal acetate esterase